MKKKLGVTFICKNNEKTIEGMLASVVSHVDIVCACDTGSTDKTLDILEEYKLIIESQGKEFYIYHDEWVDFSHNRNLSFDYISNTDVDYFFTIDSDERATFEGDIKQAIALSEGGSLTNKIIDGDITYSRFGLFKNTGKWEWSGYAHEYVTDALNSSGYSGITLHAYPKLDFKSHIERNKILLLKEIADGKCERHVDIAKWFLMQTYNDIGDTENAIIQGESLLHSKIAFSKANNNLPYSIYHNLFKNYLKLDMIGKAFEYLALVTKYRPSRAESLYLIGEYYNKLGQYDISIMFLRAAASKTIPDDNFLIQHSVYEFRAKFELSIACYYIDGCRDESKALMMELDKMTLPEAYRESLTKNLQYFK